MIIFILITILGNLQAQVGCMDNSYHLKQKFDNKELHYVSCHCPCDTYAAYGKKAPYKNKCLECGHSHEPRPSYVSSKPYKQSIPHTSYVPLTPDRWIKALLANKS